MIDEFSLATLWRTEAHEAAEFLSLINRQMILVVLCWLVASFGCGYFLFKNCTDGAVPFQKWEKRILLGIGLLWTSFFAFGVTQQFTVNDYVHKLRHISIPCKWPSRSALWRSGKRGFLSADTACQAKCISSEYLGGDYW